MKGMVWLQFAVQRYSYTPTCDAAKQKRHQYLCRLIARLWRKLVPRNRTRHIGRADAQTRGQTPPFLISHTTSGLTFLRLLTEGESPEKGY